MDISLNEKIGEKNNIFGMQTGEREIIISSGLLNKPRKQGLFKFKPQNVSDEETVVPVWANY